MLSQFTRRIGTSAVRVAMQTTAARTFVSNPVSSKLWSLGALNHVAIAVPDIDKATTFYRDVMGGNCSEKVPLPEHGVYTVFVHLGNTKIELLYPLGEKSPIEGFLKKKPEGGIHHICIEVDDVKAAIVDLKTKGIRSLDPEPKIGAHGKPVVFLHPKDCGGVLVELEQR
ncbi:Glyoxalase/Bleomycin resistance protein/Dihydroxybiphenyl dioxygenase [Polychytrium aggregatum]|uniref:Glyoxalase/Bleomycin resistance protein/Dihydroxybiphenyl dioxygenase n=1 Tax=Polychytrium aggregatum TaxID=110093 RepID=UPI0022FEAD4D|nr:Glyoxalase/Bleomycin resistance protein/Dihydroxybiphenyl dioxygenase [Polychytrium aggregatum]KAI9193386.1 Glyoxalase/Bleomycin resistance protein/Dihydroxybiphenyl dioxygenase [Polychytrium aggregatum]